MAREAGYAVYPFYITSLTVGSKIKKEAGLFKKSGFFAHNSVPKTRSPVGMARSHNFNKVSWVISSADMASPIMRSVRGRVAVVELNESLPISFGHPMGQFGVCAGKIGYHGVFSTRAVVTARPGDRLNYADYYT